LTLPRIAPVGPTTPTTTKTLGALDDAAVDTSGRCLHLKRFWTDGQSVLRSVSRATLFYGD